jgi:hypothetical protein
MEKRKPCLKYMGMLDRQCCLEYLERVDLHLLEHEEE